MNKIILLYALILKVQKNITTNECTLSFDQTTFTYIEINFIKHHNVNTFSTKCAYRPLHTECIRVGKRSTVL